MGVCCIVPWCSSRRQKTKNTQFFRVPKKKGHPKHCSGSIYKVRLEKFKLHNLQRAEWLKAINISDEQVQTYSEPRICSIHFHHSLLHTSDKGRITLLPGACPTLKLTEESMKEHENSTRLICTLDQAIRYDSKILEGEKSLLCQTSKLNREVEKRINEAKISRDNYEKQRIASYEDLRKKMPGLKKEWIEVKSEKYLHYYRVIKYEGFDFIFSEQAFISYDESSKCVRIKLITPVESNKLSIIKEKTRNSRTCFTHETKIYNNIKTVSSIHDTFDRIESSEISIKEKVNLLRGVEGFNIPLASDSLAL